MKTAFEIAKEIIPCTCGEVYKSRGMIAPDCPLHSFDVEQVAERYHAQFSTQFKHTSTEQAEALYNESKRYFYGLLDPSVYSDAKRIIDIIYELKTMASSPSLPVRVPDIETIGWIIVNNLKLSIEKGKPVAYGINEISEKICSQFATKDVRVQGWVKASKVIKIGKYPARISIHGAIVYGQISSSDGENCHVAFANALERTITKGDKSLEIIEWYDETPTEQQPSWVTDQVIEEMAKDGEGRIRGEYLAGAKDMRDLICKPLIAQQPFMCQSEIEDKERCTMQCNHCKEYYASVENKKSEQQPSKDALEFWIEEFMEFAEQSKGSAMVGWVKASDRLPKGMQTIWRFIDTKQAHYGATSSGFHFPGGVSAEYANIEWLDESVINSQQSSIKFLEWVVSSGFMKLNDVSGGKWFKLQQPDQFSTEELFKLFLSNHPEWLPITQQSLPTNKKQVQKKPLSAP